MCGVDLRVCPVLSLLPSLPSLRPRDPPCGDCCEPEATTPSVLGWDRMMLEDSPVSKERTQCKAGAKKIKSPVHDGADD